ncbi:MAG: GTPase Era [Gammaproteobacteria bacterium RIFCSPLOWO2_02_FULL_52_10]|nr:MAG: GTPase Era [Gammaproteobacteria bacterium RIFCSPLOWO2_02_FULL_52_10]
MAEHFRCGYACIIGRPNVGKSTLLNKLIGQKLSITSKKPQTTRWQLLGIKTATNYQIIFIDTPGLQNRRQSSLNRHMQREIVESLTYVNVIMFVVEALVWKQPEEQILEMIGKNKCPVLLLINKIDKLKNKEQLLPFINSISTKYKFQEIIPVSAITGDNIELTEKIIVPLLPHGLAAFPEDQLSDRNERFFAAEFIREKLTRILGAELPYKISVTIEKYTDKSHAIHIIGSIWVESEGQKKIVIGKNGCNLKSIGERSRKDMEQMFGKKVFLETWVKVRKKWTGDLQALRQFGYET